MTLNSQPDDDAGEPIDHSGRAMQNRPLFEKELALLVLQTRMLSLTTDVQNEWDKRLNCQTLPIAILATFLTPSFPPLDAALYSLWGHAGLTASSIISSIAGTTIFGLAAYSLTGAHRYEKDMNELHKLCKTVLDYNMSGNFAEPEPPTITQARTRFAKIEQKYTATFK